MKLTLFGITAILAVALGAPHHAAVAALPAAATQNFDFAAWVTSLADAIQRDARYRRIPLDTGAQVNKFSGILYRLYTGEISEDQFKAWVDVEYPGHEYEQDFIIQRLPQRSRDGR